MVTTGGRGGLRHEIQDPHAALALDQVFAAAHLVEHLRAHPDVADGAAAVARFGDGEPLAGFRHVVEQLERLRRERLGRLAAGRGLFVGGGLQRRRLRFERLPLDGDGRLLRLELRLGRLHLGGDGLGFFHALEDAILVRSDRLFGDLDLVEHRRVFLVGLELEQLSLVFGEAGLDGDDFGLDGFPLGLACGEALFDRGDRRRGLLEPRGERFLHARGSPRCGGARTLSRSRGAEGGSGVGCRDSRRDQNCITDTVSLLHLRGCAARWTRYASGLAHRSRSPEASEGGPTRTRTWNGPVMSRRL